MELVLGLLHLRDVAEVVKAYCKYYIVLASVSCGRGKYKHVLSFRFSL